MKIKIIFIGGLLLFFSWLPASPVVVKIVKEAIKKVPKVIKIVTPLLGTVSELSADEVKEQNISKKQLDLYKIKF